MSNFFSLFFRVLEIRRLSVKQKLLDIKNLKVRAFRLESQS